jgi:hypothetical protein
VVWPAGEGADLAGLLDQHAIDGFASDGFLAVDCLFDGETVAGLRAELDALRAQPCLPKRNGRCSSRTARKSDRFSTSTS